MPARGDGTLGTANSGGRDESRLRDLYAVSNLLSRFAGVEHTLFAVIDVVRRALSLRSAIFILDAEQLPRTIIWHADDVSTRWMRASQARARESYAYLAGAARALLPGLINAEEQAGPSEPEHEQRPALLLPLAVERRPIFGALQLERDARFDEDDVIFVNAIVNQLAVAIDRYAAIERQAAAELERLDAADRQVSAEAKQLRAEREQEAVREQWFAVERQRAAVEAERIAAERRCAAAEVLRQRYEALVDNLDHAFVWEADPETYRIFYVSGRAELLLGYPRQQWLEEDDLWLSCVHPRDRRQLMQTFAMALADRTDKRCDHRCVTADGRVLWFHTGVHVAQREMGPRLQGVSLDITPTKEAEERVRSQLDFTRAVTHSLGEGVIAVDLGGKVTLCNPAAGQMLGWKPAEVLGQPVSRVVQLRTADGSVLASESPFEVAMRREQLARSEDLLFVGKEGRAFPVSHISAPLQREGRISGAVLAFQDITQRRRTEQALRQAVEQANRAAHDREDLLALVSHDLKSPLSVILMTAASMAGKVEAWASPGSKDQLQIIRRSADRMNRLIQDLLVSASVDAGKLVVEPELTDVRSLLDEAIDTMRALATAKGLAIESDVSPGVPCVWADPSRVQQVLANLIGNALKFTPRDGRISVGAVAQGDWVEFTVADNGPGVAEDDLPRLFDRFWQSRQTARLGSGLGLSIVKGIVHAHGGQVGVKSTLGAGSTFSFTLRAAPAESPRPASRAPHP